jgi:hypothetical protein
MSPHDDICTPQGKKGTKPKVDFVPVNLFPSPKKVIILLTKMGDCVLLWKKVSTFVER